MLIKGCLLTFKWWIQLISLHKLCPVHQCHALIKNGVDTKQEVVLTSSVSWVSSTLHWRHNGHNSVSNDQPYDCLLNRVFRRRSKKTSKLRVTGLCEGNSPGTGEFPEQMASNAENVSIWWRHHEWSLNKTESCTIEWWEDYAHAWSNFHSANVLSACRLQSFRHVVFEEER